MKEIALYTLDIAQNSITAQARRLDITLTEEGKTITLSIRDDGTGMAPELLARVSDPFTTTRTTRAMGLGLPLLRLAAEQTGGSLSIESTLGVGTTVTAVFHASHIDCPPVGDMAGTITLLIQGAPELELHYTHRRGTPWPAWTRRSCTPCSGRSSPWPSRSLSSGSGITYKNRKRCYKNRRGCKTMKSLAELQAIRDKMRQQIDLRDSGDDRIRVVVGMATCGIAAGARPVLNAFLEEVAKRELKNVTVSQTGCIGVCRLEPIVEVYVPGQEKVTYVKMTPDKVASIVSEHLVNGRVVTEYTIGAAE